jgi:hypothetical protein
VDKHVNRRHNKSVQSVICDTCGMFFHSQVQSKFFFTKSVQKRFCWILSDESIPKLSRVCVLIHQLSSPQRVFFKKRLGANFASTLGNV